MQPTSAPADSTPYAYLWQRLAAIPIFYTAVAPISIWLSVKKQRPLDMLARTIVVRAGPAATAVARAWSFTLGRAIIFLEHQA